MTPVGSVDDYGVLGDAVTDGTAGVGVMLIVGMFAPA